MEEMKQREKYFCLLQKQIKIHPVCAILGPRQSGKTTLALQFAKKNSETTHRFDLENPEDLAAMSYPMRTLEGLSGLIIIDEIQRKEDLFPVLRVLSDRNQAKYLILGSASRELIKQSSETLAGRIGYIELTPFLLEEECDKNLNSRNFVTMTFS